MSDFLSLPARAYMGYAVPIVNSVACGLQKGLDKNMSVIPRVVGLGIGMLTAYWGFRKMNGACKRLELTYGSYKPKTITTTKLTNLADFLKIGLKEGQTSPQIIQQITEDTKCDGLKLPLSRFIKLTYKDKKGKVKGAEKFCKEIVLGGTLATYGGLSILGTAIPSFKIYNTFLIDIAHPLIGLLTTPAIAPLIENLGVFAGCYGTYKLGSLITPFEWYKGDKAWEREEKKVREEAEKSVFSDLSTVLSNNLGRGIDPLHRHKDFLNQGAQTLFLQALRNENNLKKSAQITEHVNEEVLKAKTNFDEKKRGFQLINIFCDALFLAGTYMTAYNTYVVSKPIFLR